MTQKTNVSSILSRIEAVRESALDEAPALPMERKAEKSPEEKARDKARQISADLRDSHLAAALDAKALIGARRALRIKAETRAERLRAAIDEETAKAVQLASLDSETARLLAMSKAELLGVAINAPAPAVDAVDPAATADDTETASIQ